MNNKKRKIKINDLGKLHQVRKYEVILYENNELKCVVNRRFRHFFLLSEKIKSCYEYFITPLIPEKQYLKKIKSELNESEKEMHYETRKALLEYYLDYISNHYKLSTTDEFHFFFKYNENFLEIQSFEEFYKIKTYEKFEEFKKISKSFFDSLKSVKNLFFGSNKMSLEGNEEHRKYQKLVETNQSNLKSLMHFKQISEKVVFNSYKLNENLKKMSIEINGLKEINPDVIKTQDILKTLEELEEKYRLELKNDTQELKLKVNFILDLNVWKFKKRILFH